MLKQKVAYCIDCGHMIAAVHFRTGRCKDCGFLRRRKYAERKCAGCDVMINLRSLDKGNRGSTKYHDHACYVAHRWGAKP